MANASKSQGRWEGFDAAHGFVRDGLASLRNLENLLKSPRIGPKALEKVVAELRPGIAPLGDAFAMIIDLVASRQPALAGAASLRSFTVDRVAQLDAAIAHAATSDMGAKARLQLEAKVVRLGAELDASRDLVDLLDAATLVRPTELDLNALATEAISKRTPPSVRHPRVVYVGYTPAAESATVVTDPRVIMPLLATALGLVRETGASKIQIAAASSEQGTALACSGRSNGHPATTACLAPCIIEPTLEVARSAAMLAGAVFRFEGADQRVRLAIPPAHVSPHLADVRVGQ